MAPAHRRVARNELQARLLALEKQKGMKPSHVARAAKMSLVYYQEIWSKNRVPSKKIILKIARSLDEDPKTLLFLAERERAPAAAKQFFAIHEPAQFPRLRRALMKAVANGEELGTQLAKEPLGVLEKWIYYALLAHYVSRHKSRSGSPRHFSRSARRFTPLLKEAAAKGESSLFAAVSQEMESLLEAGETQDEYVAFLKGGFVRLSYHNFFLELREREPKRGDLGQPIRYVFMSDPAACDVSSRSSRASALGDFLQAELYRSYDPEPLRRAILYSPDFETLEPGLKDLVYDEALFHSLRVTPNEFFFLRSANVRGCGGEPLKDAYKFLLEQHRKDHPAATPLGDDEQRLVELYRELNKKGREEVLIYLEFTHGKAKFRRSMESGATTEQAG